MIARATAGDPLAQRALYESHVDRVYRLAFRLAGDDDLARDFTQETFIRAFGRLGEFRRDSALSTWLHAIGVSVALNGLRKVKRFRSREVALEGADSIGTRERHADPDLKDRLARAIDALPEGYRTVFVMHDVEGYTHEEIATTLGISVKTVEARMGRALRHLRERLAPWLPESGSW